MILKPVKPPTRLGFLGGASLLIAGLSLITPAGAQEGLSLRSPTGPMTPGIGLSTHRGYAAFAASDLERLGWRVREDGDRARLTWGSDGLVVEVIPEIPFLLWGHSVVHLADAPYRAEGRTFLPVQVLVDVLPWKLPRAFRYATGSWVLEVLGSEGAAQAGGGAPRPPSGAQPTSPATPPPGAGAAAPSVSLPRPDATRVVIIDAGHGGRDPGTVGRRGTREKEVALGIALTLADLLKGEENLEVYLTRDDDTLVPLWRRGELATDLKGDRYGVFLSIHANALPSSPGTRGFETYFLSEARTEHERRVAALENAAVELEDDDGAPEGVQDMSFILTELRNLDHQHWSALLAETIQGELARIHPGPNRGVKQGPFAVITNTLMPAVLVEVGFLSNREEETLLNGLGFREDTAQALANAVHTFFDRYPPGPEGAGRRPPP